jgi:hypothetical protein
MSEGAIYFASVAEFDHENHQFSVTDLIDNSILPLPYAIPLMARELYAAGRPGVVRQLLDSANEALSILLRGNGREFLLGRGLDQNPISSHFASIP